jgi:hypothetical protein
LSLFFKKSMLLITAESLGESTVFWIAANRESVSGGRNAHARGTGTGRTHHFSSLAEAEDNFLFGFGVGATESSARVTARAGGSGMQATCGRRASAPKVAATGPSRSRIFVVLTVSTVLCWPDEATVVVDDVDDASTHDPSAARRISRHTGLL